MRYLQLAQDWRDWARVADELQVYAESECCTVMRMLEIIRRGRLRTYRGLHDYGNIRLIRVLMTIAGGTMSDSASCWTCLSSMSPHVCGLTQRRALNYEGSICIRDHLRVLLANSSYSVSDLVCFLCLIKD